MIFQADMWSFTTVEMITQILYGGLTAFLLVFGSELLNRYLKADKKTRNDAAYVIFFIIAIAVIGYGLYMGPAIVNYFYPPKHQWLSTIQQMIIVIILAPFGYVSEKLLIRKNMRISFFMILAILVIIYTFSIAIVELVNPLIFVGNMVYVILIPTYVSYLVFGLTGFFSVIIILFIRLSPQRETKRKIFLGLVGGVVALIGSLIEGFTRTNPGLNHNPMQVIGTIIEISGWLILRHYLLSVPSYSEIEWKSGMIELHVIQAEMGLSLYHYVFQKISPLKLQGKIHITLDMDEDNESRPDTDLVGGGMIGIKSMLNEIAGDKGKLQNIQIGEKNLVFKQGDAILALLLCNQNLGVYHSALRELVTEIEKAHPNLKAFDGNLENLNFAPIVDRVFGIKTEPQDTK